MSWSITELTKWSGADFIFHSGPKMSIVSVMIRSVFTLLGATLLLAGSRVTAQQAEQALAGHLNAVYQHWRHAMMTKNYRNWQLHTATHRRTSIVNRIHSERRRIACTVLYLPAGAPVRRCVMLLVV